MTLPLPTSPIFWTRSLAQFFGTLFQPFSPRPISWMWSPNSGLVLLKWWLWWPNFFDLFSGPYFGPHSWPHLLDPFPGGGIVGWYSPNGGSGDPFLDSFLAQTFGPISWPHLLDPFPGGGIVGWCSPNGGSAGPIFLTRSLAPFLNPIPGPVF